jgi:hypothetical protein
VGSEPVKKSKLLESTSDESAPESRDDWNALKEVLALVLLDELVLRAAREVASDLRVRPGAAVMLGRENEGGEGSDKGEDLHGWEWWLDGGRRRVQRSDVVGSARKRYEGR